MKSKIARHGVIHGIARWAVLGLSLAALVNGVTTLADTGVRIALDLARARLWPGAQVGVWVPRRSVVSMRRESARAAARIGAMAW